jgi:hypothetical protein
VKSLIRRSTRFTFPAISDEQRDTYNEQEYRNKHGSEHNKDIAKLEGLMTGFLHAGIAPEAIIQQLEHWKKADHMWQIYINHEVNCLTGTIDSTETPPEILEARRAMKEAKHA